MAFLNRDIDYAIIHCVDVAFVEHLTNLEQQTLQHGVSQLKHFTSENCFLDDAEGLSSDESGK